MDAHISRYGGMLERNKIKLTYKDADGQTISGEKPVNAGIYKVYVSY